MKQVRVEVVRQQGTCDAGHKPGDSWICGLKTPEGLCASAYHALFPTLRALMAGGTFPWALPDGSMEIACPDADNPVVFRLQAQ